jgi:hypothetical protein
MATASRFPVTLTPAPRVREIEEVVRLDETVFEPRDVIPAAIFLEWYQKNSNTFTLLCVSGRVIGYFSILPLAEGTLEKFKQGEITEHEFTANDILEAGESRNAKEVYFFSIVVDRDFRGIYGSRLLRQAMDLRSLAKLYPRLERIYACAATQDGSRLLERMGFSKISDSSARKDGHDLYKMEMRFRG